MHVNNLNDSHFAFLDRAVTQGPATQLKITGRDCVIRRKGKEMRHAQEGPDELGPFTESRYLLSPTPDWNTERRTYRTPAAPRLVNDDRR